MYQTPRVDAALSELVSGGQSKPESSCQKLQTLPTDLHTNRPGADLPSVRHPLPERCEATRESRGRIPMTLAVVGPDPPWQGSDPQFSPSHPVSARDPCSRG